MRALRAAAALALALLGGGARADAPPSAYPPVQQEELYLEAMRALAEGRPEQATDLLMRFLEKEPQHAGAWLDLAISQCELGHAAEAERLFGEIERRFQPPAGIVEVIAGYRTRGCQPVKDRRERMSFALARGYDTNVNQGASNAFFSTGSGSNTIEWELTPEYLPRPDRYTVLSGDYSRTLNDQGLLGFAQLRLRRHDAVREQDTNSLQLGLEQPWQWGGWRGRATAALSALQLDGHYYQRQAQLQLRATPPLRLPGSLEWSLTAGMSHVTYPTRTKYDSNTVELGNSLGWRRGPLQALGGLGVLSDHGQSGRLGGNREGWYGNILLYGLLGDRYSAQAGWARQVWRGSEMYSPGVIDLVRRQDTRQFNAGLTLELGARQSLQLEWRKVDNRENISLFQYNSRTLQLTWRWDNY